MINIPKGTKDMLPDESYKWQFVKAKAAEICALHNIREIRTPVFEHTELFLRSIGSDTDIVGKEMYTFLDKGGRSITLKPEGTASVARSYIENSLSALSLPLKMFYVSPIFRYERPQAGRLREHYQFGIEIYGDPTPYMDFEAISVAYKFLQSVGVTKLRLNINSIGCADCRKAYVERLKTYLDSHIDCMCESCKVRFSTNPLRILDCKEESCKKLVLNAPKIDDFLCDDCNAHHNTLTQLLERFEIPYDKNPWLVRGLDYYTKTVFEFVTDELGAQGTVCGGGRYDNMISQMDGENTPCVGFGLGLERLIMLLDKLNVFDNPPALDYFVLVQSDKCIDFCLRLTEGLRKKGFSADTHYMNKSLKAQFKYADKQRAEYAIVVGENEADTGILSVKRLDDGFTEQKRIEELI